MCGEERTSHGCGLVYWRCWDEGGRVSGEVGAAWLDVFFQAEDGIRDLVRARGLGDVDKRQYSRSARGACVNAVAVDARWQIRPMHPSDIPRVAAIDQAAYEFPWTAGIFDDCLRVGYSSWVAVSLAGRIDGYARAAVPTSPRPRPPPTRSPRASLHSA